MNPNAGHGFAAKHWPEIRRAAQRLDMRHDVEHAVCFTRRSGDAVALVRKAARQGVRRLVCVGGDGTLNEVVNGLMQEDSSWRRSVLLGYIPCGTGCDFARTLHLPMRPADAMAVAMSDGPTQAMDIGHLAFQGRDGDKRHAYFHNVVSFGLGGEVDERVNRSTAPLGGFLSFMLATLVSMFMYRKKRIRLCVDQGLPFEVSAWNVVVANGQYHGGGMWVAPDALPDDGLFQVIVIGDFSLPEVFLHLPKLYNGRLRNLPKVRCMSGRRIEASSSEHVLLDMDGEQPGRLPLAIDLIAGAVRVVLPRE